MDLHEPDIRTIETQAVQVDEPPPRPKRLTRKSQVAILGLVVGVAVAIFVVGPAAFRQLTDTTPAQQASEAAPASGSFKVSDKQWAALKIQPVEERVFQDASETDGKIAIDDDQVTPVFSPYSGRVTPADCPCG